MSSSGRLITTADIVDGTITTADLAASAATQAIQTILGAGATTSSGAAGPITGATVSLTTTGALVLLLASGNVYHSGAGQQIVLEFGVDAVGQGANWAIVAPGANYFVPLTMAQLVQPSAGAHTFTVRWLTSAATATVNGLVVSAIELKR